MDVTRNVLRSEWESFATPLLPIAEHGVSLLHPDDRLLRMEFYKVIFASLTNGYLGLATPHAKYPDWWPYTPTGMKQTLNNPDFEYFLTPVDGDGTYQVSGYRGTCLAMSFTTGGGRWLTRGLVDEPGPTFDAYEVDANWIADDGSFEVILSAERPDGYTGPWWQLHREATYLLQRQVFYDWLQEEPARVAIDRLDVPPTRPRASEAELEEDLAGLAKWTDGYVQKTIRVGNLARENDRVNAPSNVFWDPKRGYSQMLTQSYALGGFDLAPGEALLIEVPVPETARYWSFHLGDDISYTIDWVNRLTSINGFEAVIDDDGVFRVVVAGEDPGTPNWLDTMGYHTGTMCIRWEGCPDPPREFSTRRLQLTDLADVLPAGTPRVSPAQRDAAIRRRRRGIQMRKRW